MSEALDLRSDDTIPVGLKDSLTCLGKGTGDALATYFAYQGRGGFTRMKLNGGFGDINSQCELAAEVASRFGLLVLFTFNGITVRAHPTTAAAAGYDWANQQ